MNIQTREEFDKALEAIRNAKSILIVDTETTGLNIHQEDYLVSVQILIDGEKSYNFPFRHGKKEIPHAAIPEGKWTKDKKEAFLNWAYFTTIDTSLLGNLPIEWLSDLRDTWNIVAKTNIDFLFHNAPFDLHVLQKEGFVLPYNVKDTMIALYVLLTDWQAVDFTVNGKKVKGNRKLKWQAELWGFPEAREGELLLQAAINELKELIAERLVIRLLEKDTTNLEWANMKSFQVNPEGVSRSTGLTWRETVKNKIKMKLSLDSKKHIWMLPSFLVTKYGELDTLLTWKLYNKLMPLLEKWGSKSTFDWLNDLQKVVCYDIEHTGFLVDKEAIKLQIEELTKELERVDNLLNQYLPTGLEPNWNSPKWLKEVLQYNGIDVQATDKAALKPYKDHELVKLLHEKRKIQKAKTTYLEAWLTRLDKNSRLHGNVHMGGTKTGRFSSSNPNLQNIPDRGYSIKRVIVPQKGNILFAIDYGQLEARFASWLAEGILELDPKKTMTTLFNDGTDIHSFTRDRVNIREIAFPGMSDDEILLLRGFNPAEVTDKEYVLQRKIFRYIAKTMNFGLLYRGTKFMLSKLLDIDIDIADDLVIAWNELFPAFHLANEYFEKLAKEYRSTPTGVGSHYQYVQHYMPFREATSSAYWLGLIKKMHPLPEYRQKINRNTGEWYTENPRAKAQKDAFNVMVQGACGLLTALSMFNFRVEVPNNAPLLLWNIIHDSLDGECDVNNLYLVKELSRIMTDWDTDPKLVVDIEASLENWQDMKTVRDIDMWVASKGVTGY